MSRERDFLPPHLVAKASSPLTLATLEQLLAAHWDPDGEIRRRLAVRPDGPDPTRPRNLGQVAAEVAGILGSGGDELQVGGYLKREEFALFGSVDDETLKTSRRARREFVRGALWRAVRGISRPGDLRSSPDGAG
jgi:hypothetical protein